ncbi:MAG: hypothetical protein Q9194_004341 [Teloschistes cf. exilis]
MVPTAVDVYTFDKSGIHANPRPGISVKPHVRIDHLAYVNFHTNLLGKGLAKVYQGFAVSLLRRLPSFGIENQWPQHSDLLNFWMLLMTPAMNEAPAGPIIECVNPGFAKDPLQYYPYLHSLLKGWPKWLIPEAYRLQKSFIRDVATWHAIARARFHVSDIDKTTGYDPWWGSAFMRERQQILRHVNKWDAHSIAASDFGFFWGDKQLLFKVREELARVEFHGTADTDDIEKLLASPLLQSICNELLRLRVEVQTIFSSDKEDIQINEWRIPKGSLVVVPAWGCAQRPSSLEH